MACADKRAKPVLVSVTQMSSYFRSPKKSSCYFPLATMLLVLCIFQFMFCMTYGCIHEEKTALMRIRSSLVDANSEVLASWGRSDDCCSWERVRCNENSTRVSDLYLSEIYTYTQGLSIDADGCSLTLNLMIFTSFHELRRLDLSANGACLENSSGLQRLTKLRYLNLSDNRLIGNSILRSLDKLASLQVINLSRSEMSGPLQNIAFRNLKYLQELHLASNYLNGSIPASLFELQHLEYLDLSENFLQRQIPMNSSLNLPSSLQTLKLSENYLDGTFDFFWLRNCTMLRKIDLSGNTNLAIDVKFRGRVPPFQLKELMLSGCNLDKSIIAGPNFLVTQDHIQILDLSNNNLTGSMPNWISTNEETLVYLNLANNSLVGSLDLMWQHQSNLQMLDISENLFVGQLPNNISSVIPNLKVLDASHNFISGDLPLSLCNISSMVYMDLSSNKFTGEVPTCFFTDFSMLKILKLSNNNLGGPILGGASNLSSVSEIYLGSNNFDGALPSNLSGNLEVMDLHDNKLSGELDASYWNLSSLRVLSVATNSLSGEIYPAICKLTSLLHLDVSDNNFAGSLPNCIIRLALHCLNMSGNSLSGSPSGFLNGSYVTALDLRNNQFTGSLGWVQCLPQIDLLLLGWNRFEGQISPYLCHHQFLNVIDLSHNRLSGSLPPCIGGIFFGISSYHISSWRQAYNIEFGDDGPPFTYYSSYYYIQGLTFFTKGNRYTYGPNILYLMLGIDLSANMLSGEIPWEIGDLNHVKSLNLSHNLFTGQIPGTLANMSAMESLDLSHNALSGPIPWQLTHLWSLEVFSVAYNNLSGCIPSSGQLGTFSSDSYQGNSNLHEISYGNGCSLSSGPVAPEGLGEACDDRDPVLYTVTAVSFVLGLWGVIAFLLCHPFGRHAILKL